MGCQCGKQSQHQRPGAALAPGVTYETNHHRLLVKPGYEAKGGCFLSHKTETTTKNL
jgi:hypothetical protein